MVNANTALAAAAMAPTTNAGKLPPPKRASHGPLSTDTIICFRVEVAKLAEYSCGANIKEKRTVSQILTFFTMHKLRDKMIIKISMIIVIKSCAAFSYLT